MISPSGITKKIALGILAFVMIAATDDALQKLNITLSQAENYVSQTVQFGQFTFPMSVRNIAPALRLQIAKDMAGFAKSFCQSSAFKSQYTDWWQNQKPEKPESLEDRKKAMDDKKISDQQNADEGLENMRKQIKETTDPSTKKALEDALKQYQEMKKQMDEQMNTPEMKGMMAQADSLQQQQMLEDFRIETERYVADSIAWMKKINPDAAVKNMLVKYLDIVKTVDFNASTTKNKFGKLIFDKEEYEQKQSEWKQCFRAGKELNDFAKGFAQQWIGQLK